MLFIGIITMLVSLLVQWKLKSKFKEYSQIGLQSGLSGAEVATKMLRDYGIHDVKVMSVQGHLSDHYNPMNKTVNLSPDVYEGRSAAAVAVAAHECGHAVQHATKYGMLMLRSRMVPIVNVASMVMPWLIMAGAVMFTTFPALIQIGIVFYAVTTVFTVITLPVEFDASNRALAWIDQRGIVNSREHAMAKDALWWAAMTYVVAAIGSIAELLYLIMRFSGSRD